MKVALLQHDVAFEDARATCEHLGPLLKEAAGRGAEMVVLTEMFATGFSMASDKVAEQPPAGIGESFLKEMAARTGAAVCGSLPVRQTGPVGASNRFICAFPDGHEVSYDKIHPFSLAGEDAHYDAGNRVVTFGWRGVTFTPFVCYDLRFGETFWAVADKTDCFIVVSNWPAARQGHFRALVLARAIENQAYVLATNRVGTGGGLEYGGGSIAVGPFGEVLAEAGSTEEILLTEVSASKVQEVRARYPFLADRRPFEVVAGP